MSSVRPLEGGVSKISYFKDKIICITGGGGSLGSALVPRLLDGGAKVVRILDNNEHSLFKLEERFGWDRVRYLIGSILDRDRLKHAMEDVDVVFHAAAYKIIPYGEYSPTEAVKTNIIGSQNVAEVAMECNVGKVVGVSSDKSCSPLNLYGSTKLCMEKIFVSLNFYKGKHRTQFFCTRYGNVLGSQNSVTLIWKEQLAKNKPLTLTKGEMTRFQITLQEGVDFIFRSVQTARGAEVFVPKLKAYYVRDLLDAFIEAAGSKPEVQEIPVRPGEKSHELLINEYEMQNTVMFGPLEDYAILPEEATMKRFSFRFYFDQPVKFPEPKPFGSEDAEKLTKDELASILKREGLV